MDADRRKKLESLERRVGYSFNDKRLLDMALTHTSYVKGDGRASAHNERLEFLGDAVLELCVSEYLYNRFAEYNEGDMTRLRAQTVCEGALYDVAKKLELGKSLLLGRGEDHSGGREKPSILSDAVEDDKTMLQEYVQKRHMGQIAYVLTGSSGPDHNKVFNMDVTVAGAVVGSGDGKTKQEAGQHAAKAALEEMGIIPRPERNED